MDFDFNAVFDVDMNTNSTKSLILKALAVEHQLSVSELQKILKKRFSKSISYQAIRKTLIEMIDTGIILKNDNNNYFISEEWVYGLKRTAQFLEKAVLQAQKVKVIDKTTTQINVRNIYELGHFVLFSLEQRYFDFSKDNELFMRLNHLLIPFTSLTKRQRLKEMLQKNKTFIAVKSTSLGDRIFGRWYKNFVKLKLGANFSAPSDYIVHGQTIVQIYLPDELKKDMLKIYQYKGMISLDIFQKLADLTNKEYGINIVITRNKDIAEQMKSDIKKFF